MQSIFWELGLSEFCQKLEIKSNDLAQKLYHFLYHNQDISGFSRLSELSPVSLTRVYEILDFTLPRIHTLQKSQDGTIKFLLELRDGKKIETVLIPFYNKYTLCLSSQVGCAMNCSFCHTATQGLSRQLMANEIIGQVVAIKKWCKNNLVNTHQIGRLVFMGQGEPLHNFDNLKISINILTQKKLGLFGPRNITVSTSGYLPGIERFHELGGVNMALSLHSAIDDVRTELIPLNRRYPLTKVLMAMAQVPRKKRQHIEYEYLMIDNINDDENAAQVLAKLVEDYPGMVNLIPINPFQGNRYKRPSLEKIENFKQILVKNKIRVMERKVKGEDIMAACGQLHSDQNH